MKESQQHAKSIIFDLDGTIADSLSAGIAVLNEMKIIDRTVTREDYEKTKNLTIKDIFKEFGVPMWRAPQLAVKGRIAIAKRISEIPFFEGMDETIHALSANHRLFIMSSNSLANVQKFLELHNVRKPFEQIYGGAGIFGKAKVLNKVIRQNGLDKNKTYYVGDEVRDVLAAKKVGLKSVSVTWGFNGDKILSAQNPDYLVHTPKELKQVFFK